MTEQAKRMDKRFLPAVIAALILIGTAMWVSVLLPETPADVQPAERGIQRVLREWKGQVALFEGNAEQPVETYEVVVDALPPEEQERLREGIAVESEEMLAALLDNYTS